jgi:hypothetical protein
MLRAKPVVRDDAAAGGVGMYYGWLPGWWLLTGGGLGLVTATLLFWRLLAGAAVAAPLWVIFTGVVVAVTMPGPRAVWITTA